jgi:ABC-type phosphate/phosphonate transport system substrate-binding protein
MVGSRASFGFGLARSLDFHASLSTFTELCELLGREIGTVFYPHHALSYDALGTGLERGELGLAWTPPIPAIEALDRSAAVLLIAPIRRGSTMFHSALIVRPNGPTSIDALRGLRVGWVDRASAGGHLVPKMYLAASGYSLRGFFSQELFLGSHIAVIDALLSERIDVGATFCKVQQETGRIVHASWTDAEGKVARPVHALTTIGPIPNDVIVASSRLPKETQNRVLRWFLDPPSPRAKELLAEVVRADLSRSVVASHFEPLRRMMLASAARGETPWRDRPSVYPPAR